MTGVRDERDTAHLHNTASVQYGMGNMMLSRFPQSRKSRHSRKHDRCASRPSTLKACSVLNFEAIQGSGRRGIIQRPQCQWGFPGPQLGDSAQSDAQRRRRRALVSVVVFLLRTPYSSTILDGSASVREGHDDMAILLFAAFRCRCWW